MVDEALKAESTCSARLGCQFETLPLKHTARSGLRLRPGTNKFN